MKCAIIGAGLSGLTCAEELSVAGHDVVLFDKGRRAGGRMSTRRLPTRFGEAGIDHGAPYFDALGSAFRATVATWQRDGMVVPWPAGGPHAWLGIPDMATLIARLAGAHEVKWQTFVNGIMRAPGGKWLISTDRGYHGPFDTVVTAVPPEQAVPFLALYDLEMARTASSVPSRTCWAGIFVFASALPAASLVLRNAGPIALAVCNRAKPLRTKPESWLLHANPEWSEAHLELESEDIVPMLRTAFQDALEMPALPAHEAVAHRWRYASSAGIGRTALWSAELKLGACGDWLIGPHAECAWTSGRALGRLVNSTFNGLSTVLETVLE
jgi:renalase